MLGDLHITSDGSLRTAQGQHLLAAESFTWCTVLRRDDCAVHLPETTASAGRVIEVPRRPELLFSLLADKVCDELAIAAALHAETPALLEIDRLVADFGLTSLLQRNPLDLSGGEKAKLAMCIALLARPQVLVLDDVMDPIDVEMRPRVVNALRFAAVKVVDIRTTAPSVGDIVDVVVLPDGAAWSVLGASDYLEKRSAFLPKYMRHLQLTPGPVILEAHGLTYTYPGSFRLPPVDLTARAGERVRIAGRNGSGKSTLLKALAQLLMPDNGEVSISAGRGNEPLSLRYPLRRRTKGLARVLLYQFQEPSNQLYCATVLEELQETAIRSGSRNPRSVYEVAHILALTSQMNMSPWDLSEGQRRMLSLGSILCANPPLILADEPTAQLDWEQRTLIAQALNGFVADGGACLFIAHDESFSAAMASRTIFVPGESPTDSTILLNRSKVPYA
jgi:energy-coupling factor transport system ATP-binding protein